MTLSFTKLPKEKALKASSKEKVESENESASLNLKFLCL